MTNKELSKLCRTELLEILIAQGKEQERLQQERLQQELTAAQEAVRAASWR